MLGESFWARWLGGIEVSSLNESKAEDILKKSTFKPFQNPSSGWGSWFGGSSSGGARDSNEPGDNPDEEPDVIVSPIVPPTAVVRKFDPLFNVCYSQKAGITSITYDQLLSPPQGMITPLPLRLLIYSFVEP
jgi:hypothetical protein